MVVGEPAVWTSAGPAEPAGVVTGKGVLWFETLPAPSRASTVYW